MAGGAGRGGAGLKPPTPTRVSPATDLQRCGADAAGRGGRARSRLAESGHTPFDEPPALANPDEIREALGRVAHRFRDELAEDLDTARVWLFINELGEVPQVRTNRSTGNEKMDAVALGLAASMRFEPARRDGEPTPVWVSLPITMTRR